MTIEDLKDNEAGVFGFGIWVDIVSPIPNIVVFFSVLAVFLSNPRGLPPLIFTQSSKTPFTLYRIPKFGWHPAAVSAVCLPTYVGVLGLQ